MTAGLTPRQVGQHVAELRRRSVLTALQAARLDAIVATMAEDGRFVLRDALVEADFPEDDARGQDAFQDFRKRVNQAAAAAGVELALELESRKTPPDRRQGWFTGGDLVDNEITLFTEAAARQTGIDHPVRQEVTELGKSRRTRLYVSFLPPADRAHTVQVNTMLRQLRVVLAQDPGQSWEVSDTLSTAELGEEAEAARSRRCELADVRVALLTPGYLTDDSGERDRALRFPFVACALTHLPDGAERLGPLPVHDIRWRAKPWDQLTRTDQRQSYIGELANAVRNLCGDDHLVQWSQARATSRPAGDSNIAIEPELAETTLLESALGRSTGPLGKALPAIERLVDWACGSGTQPLCALLGDVGMGKTTTTKLFTQRLLERRTAGADGPLPILFDLRDVRVSTLAQDVTLDHILTSMLDANRPAGLTQEHLTADAIRRRVGRGDAVVIFDGLDEVLVHLSPHDQQIFTRQLWRTVDEKSGSKMLLTCRTQYFRTIREEATYFLGQDRQGLRGENYLALLMLPFREELVREYLIANVDRDESRVDGFLDTLARLHDLPELASRPLTLRLIADQVKFIESTKLHGGKIRAVDLYREFVDRWLSRDNGRHTLQPEHKQLLMEHLAAALWRSSRNSWQSEEVENWLLDFLDRRRNLQLHYRERVPDLWKVDFRTATFLSREGDTFSFGHRSLFEYFLAGYLCRTLTDTDTGADDALGSLAMPMPSTATLDFLGQLLDGLPGDKRSAALATLRRTATTYVPRTSELAFSYAVHAAKHGHPHQSLVGVQLPGAELVGWEIGSGDGADDSGPPPLQLCGANLRAAVLRRAVLYRVDLSGADLSGADLTNAEFHESRLASMCVAGAQLVGTILRRCEIGGVDLESAAAYRAQLILCSSQPEPATGYLVAPAGPETPSTGHRLHKLTACGGVSAVAYSPDGTRIITGGGRSVHVWDGRTGELLHKLTSPDVVLAVLYSPDGASIVTAGGRLVRTWDAGSGEPRQDMVVHAEAVRAVAFSPDGACLVAAGGRSVEVWDAATGVVRHRLVDQFEAVWSVAYAPDGRRIVVGGRRGLVWIVDAATGQLVRTLTSYSGKLRAVSYSPDGRRIIACGSGSVLVWDAGTGEVIYKLSVHWEDVWAVSYSPDGAYFVTGDRRSVLVWDAATGKIEQELQLHSGGVAAVAYSPDGKRIIVGSRDGLAWIWDVDADEVGHELFGQSDGVQPVMYAPTGDRIAAGAGGLMRLWDAVTGELVREFPRCAGRLLKIAFAPDGSRLVTGDGDGLVRIWDAGTGEVVRDLRTGSGAVWEVAFSPDGAWVLAGKDNVLRLWDSGTGKVVRELPGDFRWVHAVAFSPDSSRMVIGGEDSAWVYDVQSWQVVRELPATNGWVNAVAFSPDGTHIVTSSGAVLHVWNAKGDAVRELHGCTRWVNAVACSRDGNRIVASERESARIWDSDSGEQLCQLSGHSGDLRSVIFSPDGSRILTSDGDGLVRVWDAADGTALGFDFLSLPDGEAAVFAAKSRELVGASEGAWRWLGWNVVLDGRMTRLPAETFGQLPPLRRRTPRPGG